MSEVVAAKAGPGGRKALALKAGIEYRHFARLLRGERSWYLTEMERVADALGEDMVELVGEAENLLATDELPANLPTVGRLAAVPGTPFVGEVDEDAPLYLAAKAYDADDDEPLESP